MPTLPTKPVQFLLIIALLLIASTGLRAQSQDPYFPITFRIDSLINVGLPKSALALVDRLDRLARKNHNDAQQINSVIYRITLQSYLKENALQEIVSQLKIDIQKADFPVKPVLQSLLAEIYWDYYKENRWNFAERTKLDKPDADFTKWDLQTLTAETSNLYQQSLADEIKEQATPVSILNSILDGDHATRSLRPTLYDLLVHRALDFFLQDESELARPKKGIILTDPNLYAEGNVFAHVPLRVSDTASNYYQGIILLQKATALHVRQNHTDAVADLDFERLEFLNSHFTGENNDTLYVQALKRMAVSLRTLPVSAQALALLAGYYENKDDLITAYYYAAKAIKAYPFSRGGRNAANTREEITKRNLRATMENVEVPGKPILATLTYRNLKKARVEVYRVTPEMLTQLISKKQWNEQGSPNANKTILKILRSFKPVQSQDLTLPVTSDYKEHTTEFKIDPLSPAAYLLLMKNQDAKDSLTSITNFSTSNLSYAIRATPDNQQEIRVLNRETGAPLAGVKVSLFKWADDYHSNKKEIYLTGTSDKDGSCILNDKKDRQSSIMLSVPGDTYIGGEGYGYYAGTAEQNSVNATKMRTIMFTDRQIYRPGQTIYFKGIQIQITDGKNAIVPQKDLTVYLKDANNQLVSSLTLRTNSFGSIAGSFIIPQNRLAGQMVIHTDDGGLGILVEEYKRPTFNITFLPITETYHPGDSVHIKGKVATFSGYGLSGARLSSQINVRMRPVYTPHSFNRDFGGRGERGFEKDTVTTNDQGEFTISFKAKTETDVAHAIYDFSITADVTDASGETRSAETSVPVSNEAIQIDVNLPENFTSNDRSAIPVNLKNLFDQTITGKISIQIYALKQAGQTFKERKWQKPDQHLLNRETFKNTFPAYAYQNEDQRENWLVTNVVDTVTLAANSGTGTLLSLDQFKKQKPGVYKVVFKARSASGDTTSIVRYINLIGERALAQNLSDWVLPVITTVKKGQKAIFYVGKGGKSKVLMEMYNGPKILSAQWLDIDGPDQLKVEVAVPSTPHNSISVQFLTVNDNRQFSYYQKLTVKDTVAQLKMRLLTYRDKMQPGGKEQWKIRIADSNDGKPAAELLAAMYDASLDDVAGPQEWGHTFRDEFFNPPYYAWRTIDFTTQTNTTAEEDFRPGFGSYNINPISYETLVVSNLQSSYTDYLRSMANVKRSARQDKLLLAKYAANARLIRNGYDVIGQVVNYDGFTLAGAKISIKNTQIRTKSNSMGYFRIKVPVKGTLVFSFGDNYYMTREWRIVSGGYYLVKLSAHDKYLEVRDSGPKSQKGDPTQDIRIDEPVGNSDTKAMVEDNAMYAPPPPRVSMVRFPPPVVKADMEKLNEPPTLKDIMSAEPGPKDRRRPIAIRKNFSETAFFYPQLNTNEKGEIEIAFTAPDALTQWKFRAFAHTRDLQTDYLEQTTVTQKELSIEANTPRFFREGDTITVSARLANLTDEAKQGTAKMKFFNALNMQPVQLFATKADAEQSFNVAAKSNKAVSFHLVIPAGLDAVTYQVTAEAGLFSDGEEKTLPVLPNRELVIESMPMMVRAGESKSFTFDKLVNQKSTTLKNKTLTLEYTQNPAWYAVQAMPYLMEFPYECAEQTFSRYFANSLATNLINKMPVIKQVFDQWKNTNSTMLLSNLERNPELKATLLEETPWLQNAENETEQKNRIALLFDLNRMGNELKLNLDKLQKLQLNNGGFVWFGGDRADRYITQHILAGMGQLYHLNIDPNNATLKLMSRSAIHYMDGQLLEDDKEAKKSKNYETRTIDETEEHAWYARSFFPGTPMSINLKKVQATYLDRAESQWLTQGVYQQGMIALTMLRYGKADVARKIINSLLETAQQSDELGMYWRKNQSGYYWYESPVETQSLLIALFTEAGGQDKAVSEMKIWLLRNKQTNSWQTTKATSAAIYALLMKNEDWLSSANTSVITLNGKSLSDLKPDTKTDAGSGYTKTVWTDEQVKPALGHISISNKGTSVSFGALHWQYLEQMDKITPASTNIRLRRNYYIVKPGTSGDTFTLVDNSHQPKAGDLLKVIVYLDADRDFEYVQLKDLRPAGTEPVSTLSEWKYQGRLFYYQVTKDVATNFFISRLNKGSYVFEYQLRVAQPGHFSTGVATVQCMYAPEFNAHSQGGRIGFVE